VAAEILIGVSGWSYADWEGIVYPRRRPRGFAQLAHVASFLDTVEINTRAGLWPEW